MAEGGEILSCAVEMNYDLTLNNPAGFRFDADFQGRINRSEPLAFEITIPEPFSERHVRSNLDLIYVDDGSDSFARNNGKPDKLKTIMKITDLMWTGHSWVISCYHVIITFGT